LLPDPDRPETTNDNRKMTGKFEIIKWNFKYNKKTNSSYKFIILVLVIYLPFGFIEPLPLNFSLPKKQSRWGIFFPQRLDLP